MSSKATMLASQRVVQVCLFLIAAIAMLGGALQMYLGEPETMPRLDNVHRFMAGIYFSTGLINLWAALCCCPSSSPRHTCPPIVMHRKLRQGPKVSEYRTRR